MVVPVNTQLNPVKAITSLQAYHRVSVIVFRGVHSTYLSAGNARFSGLCLPLPHVYVALLSSHKPYKNEP